MTDKEMAVEYICNGKCQDRNFVFCRNCTRLSDFLAGLKEGKGMNVPTKWHDLRKDPNDLHGSHYQIYQQGAKKNDN